LIQKKGSEGVDPAQADTPLLCPNGGSPMAFGLEAPLDKGSGALLPSSATHKYPLILIEVFGLDPGFRRGSA
jgi:hypothetical protein